MLSGVGEGTAQGYESKHLPGSVYSGRQGSFHVQGIAVDEANGFVYFSFTNKLIKTDLSGKLIGSVVGFTGHLGDIVFDPETNRIYGSLEFKNDAIGRGISKKLGVKNSNLVNFYVAIFECGRIVKPDMNVDEGDLLRTVWLKEPVKDYNAEVYDGRRLVEHRYGCSGIDGITIGPMMGNKKSSKRYLYVAYGIYGDTSRSDNDRQVILQYDLGEFVRFGQVLYQENPHHSGPKAPLSKYFLRTGNTRYGVQNMAYDSHSGNFYLAVYKGAKKQFPNYDLFVVNGSKKPYKSDIIENNKTTKVRTLSLLNAGNFDRASQVWGWYFNWGSTGLCPLKDGLFYISHNRKSENGLQETTIYKYKWIGNAEEAFLIVK